jgi:RNA polymerase sigma-70 factor (ECF subfamily)
MPETVTLDNERHVWLLSAVRRLPDDRQQLIVLKFVERMSNAEIGAIMERTEGAIKSLYHRTLIALRQELGHTKEQGEKNDDD